MLKISVLGDSISTYEGFNPNGYNVYYDSFMQSQSGLLSVDGAWWARVIAALGGELCVNDSYSGSTVAGGEFPSAASEERLGNLAKGGEKPDFILIYLGFNDFGYGINVKKSFLDNPTERNLWIFEDAYDYMLSRLRELYPNAKIIPATLMRSKLRGEENWTFAEKLGGFYFNDYNAAIQRAAKKNGCVLADLAAADLRYESLDGAHPTAVGHEEIAARWLECLGVEK